MRLEYRRYLTVGIQLPYAARALIDFLRMMCVIGKEDKLVGLYLEIETPFHTTIGLQSVLQFLCRASAKLRHRHCGYTVFNIYRYGLSKPDITHILYRRYEIERYLSVADSYILGMKVSGIKAVFVHSHTFLHLLPHLKTLMYDKGAALLYKSRIMSETLEIRLFGPVNIEMVRVGGSDDAYPWTQPMERAVELVCLYHYIIAVA